MIKAEVLVVLYPVPISISPFVRTKVRMEMGTWYKAKVLVPTTTITALHMYLMQSKLIIHPRRVELRACCIMWYRVFLVIVLNEHI